MYNRQNLPLSPLKVVKKSLGLMLLHLIIGVFFIILGWLNLKYLEGTVETQKLLNLGGIIWIFFWLLATVIYQYLYYLLYDYDFEEAKARIKKGVVSQSTGFVRYERLQNIYVDQDLEDRIFGLYDVHYETAGETSSFYSHVDGLNKENADKLVAFLNDQVAEKSQSLIQPEIETATQETAPVANQAELNSANYRMSRSYLFVSTLNIFIALGFIFAFVFGYIILDRAESQSLSFITAGNSVYYIVGALDILLVLIFIYQVVWFNNFYFSFKSDKGEIRTKVIGQSISYLYYNRIQNVNINQGVLERIFGLYTIKVETAGEASSVALILPGYKKDKASIIRNFLLEKAKVYKKNL